MALRATSTRALRNAIRSGIISSHRGLFRQSLTNLRQVYHYSTTTVTSNSIAASKTPSFDHESDAELRKVFDSSAFWNDFSAPNSRYTGLFDNPYLDSPQGITKFTEVSLLEAKSLASDIIEASAPEELRNIVRKLDRLSDTLCKVIDMVSFVRMSHPSQPFLDAAQRSHEVMFEYMNVLNTSVEMYQKLEQVLNDPDIANMLSEEETTVGNILLTDFKRSGANLDPESRSHFIEISNSVSIYGQQFITEAQPVQDYISFPSKRLQGLDPQLARQMSRFGKVRIPTSGPVSSLALRTIYDENIRRELWLAQRTASEKQENLLTSFLTQRARLASIMGSRSFSEYELKDKMIKDPQHVNEFLSDLSDRTYDLAKGELKFLADLKAADTGDGVLQAWDRDYYSARYFQSKRNRAYTPDSLSSYFSLGIVMQGLSRLFSRIYGISFIPAETANGEVWDKDVRRLDVVSETEGKIGVMYCDLFEREGKSPNPAHFTVQCSREILPDEPNYYNDSSLLEVSGKKFQTPIIALICDFNRTTEGDCLLSFSEVETLFHEMGHAIHSMLGRTSLHNVAGTRCATDFVELPSVLMERFASSPQVLALYARHYKTGEPLPYNALQSYLDTQAVFQHCETYNQIKLSMLDQSLHSGLACDSNFDPRAIYQELEDSKGLFPSHEGSQWHTYFGHLFNYGATYYCYLFDRAIADRIWKKLFESDPLSREAGERFKNEVLSWGGSRNPWKCVAGVLGQSDLEKGDKHAVLDIGRSMDL